MPTNCRLFLPVLRLSLELLPSFLFMIDFSMPITVEVAERLSRLAKHAHFCTNDINNNILEDSSSPVESADFFCKQNDLC